jgi:lipopolysaccharide export LptBFGC system permease protein LptF
MFTTKLNLVAPLALAVLGVIAASTEAALAGTVVPAPIIGAGLPALAVLAGGYWLLRKIRERR